MEPLSKFGLLSASVTSCSGSGYGRGFRSTPFTTENSAVLAPIPSARVRIATKAKPGDFTSMRTPKRRSCVMRSNKPQPHTSRVTSFTNPTFPNSRLAARSASLAASPLSTRSFAAISRWDRTSSSSSASRLFRRQKFTSHPPFLLSLPLLWIQYPRDRIGELRPFGAFLAQLLLAGGRQPVILGALLIFGGLPFRFDPPLSFQTVQCGIERARVYLQGFAGAAPDGDADTVAVLRPPLQGLQDQQVQRPLQQFNPVLIPRFLLCHLRFLRRCVCSCCTFDVATPPKVLSQGVGILHPASRRSTPLLRASPVPLWKGIQLLFQQRLTRTVRLLLHPPAPACATPHPKSGHPRGLPESPPPPSSAVSWRKQRPGNSAIFCSCA